jgi:hypothetical protein
MIISITFVLTPVDVFCFLLCTTFALLIFAAVSWEYRKPKVDDVDAVPSAIPSVVTLVPNNALPTVVTNISAAALVTLNRKYLLCQLSPRIPPMPTFPEETLHELRRVSFEVPTCQQLKCLVQPSTTTSADADSCDASAMKSGEPPCMAVIYEETEKDLKRDNLRVVPLTGKHRPLSVPVIIEETVEDRALWIPLDCTPSPKKVQPTAFCVVCTGSKCNASSPVTRHIMRITRGVYKGSSCSVLSYTAKMVEIRLPAESKTRKIKKKEI